MKKPYLIAVIVVLVLISISVFVYIKNNSRMINGISVPPEPSSSMNNATLAGVDTNNNGVRDDVERLIAQKFGGTADYQYILAYAKQYQLRFVTLTPTRRSDALIQVSRELCTVENESDAARRFDMRSLFENTAARKQTNRAFYDVLVGFIPEELPPCASSTAQTN